MDEKLVIRLETPADHRAVELLTRRAFEGYMVSGCNEHYLAHVLRSAPEFIPELDFVALERGELVGNVMFSRASVVDSDGTSREVLTFGPLSVEPAKRGHGIGSALLRRSLNEAKRLGYSSVALTGHPDYYPRFGFRPAKEFGITFEGGVSADALMAMELRPGALDGVRGVFREAPAFEVDDEAVKRFDAELPPFPRAKMLRTADAFPKPLADVLISHGAEFVGLLNCSSGREILTWDGVGERELALINEVLTANGYARKLSPDDPALARAARGFGLIEE